jgi:chorismate mutase
MRDLKKEIQRRRDYIDKIDAQLLKLLNRRVVQVKEIGRLKVKVGIKARSARREKEVMRNVSAVNHGPLSVGAIRRIFKLIMKEARYIECAIMDEIKKGAN